MLEPDEPVKVYKSYNFKPRLFDKFAKLSNQQLIYKMRHTQSRPMRKLYALHLSGMELRLSVYMAINNRTFDEEFSPPCPPLIPPTRRDRQLLRNFYEYPDMRLYIINLIDDNDTRNRLMKIYKDEKI